MASKQYEAFKNKVYGFLVKYKQDVLGIKAKGVYNHHEYDHIFPEPEYSASLPVMLYPGIRETIEKIKADKEYSFKPHLFASKHVASSQTACLNLFTPILESVHANEILKASGVTPPGFDHIDRDPNDFTTGKLFHGYQFEFWQHEGEKGLLGDHTSGAGTDSDIAIAYVNRQGGHCLWLIEHKLTEQEFTTCGGYSSDKITKANKEHCKSSTLEELCANPQQCHYHCHCHYKYWEIMNCPSAKAFFSGPSTEKGCPFRGGMNQLWRNQLVALELERLGKYEEVYFSVVFHPENIFLEATMTKYKQLINHNPKFYDFKSDKLVNAAVAYLPDWAKWYKRCYYGEQ